MTHTLRPQVAAAALVLLAVLPHASLADWPVDPQINVPVCNAVAEQRGPVIVADGAGGAIIAWADDRNGKGSGIYAQRVRATGAPDPAWPAQGLALRIGNTQAHPEITTDGAGGAIVTWELDSDVQAHHVLASGVLDPAWPSGGLTVCSAPGYKYRPTIVTDGAGGAIVAWGDYRNGGGFDNSDVYTQHVLAGGAHDPAWPVDGFPVCTASGEQYPPRMVGDGAGGALLVWDGVIATHDLYAHHVLATGIPDPAWPVNGRAVGIPSTPTGIALAQDGSGGLLVAWPDYRSGTSYDMYAQHVLASGIVDPGWPAGGRLLSASTRNQLYPQIVTDGGGGALVTWEDYAGPIHDVYTQHLLVSGVVDPSWPADGRALCTAPNAQERPVIVSDGEGGVIVAWGDARDYSDIYAGRVFADGAVDTDWPVDGRALCTAPGSQYLPCAVEDGAGGAIVAWVDFRNGDGDIYAQRVQSNGQLGRAVVDVSAESFLPFALEIAGANPVRGGSMTVRFTLRSAAPASLELLDAAGRSIIMLDVGAFGAGRHSIDMGTAGLLRPGIYFVRLAQAQRFRVKRVAVLN